MELEANLLRHNRLLYTGALLGSVATLAGCGGGNMHHKSSDVYKAGDTIQVVPGLPAQVEDWHVLFKGADISRYIDGHQNEEVDIQMTTQNGIEDLKLTASSIVPSGGAVLDIKTGNITMDCNPPGHPDCYLTVVSDHTKYSGLKLKRVNYQSRVFEIKPSTHTT